jgi:hypothetical protein
MRTPRRLVVVTHARDTRARRRPFVIWGVREVWERVGIEVMVAPGVDRFVDADVAVAHVSLTVMPEAYRYHLARYPVAVNGAATDVSKRRVSQCLVLPGDGYDGPVIVKTDRNFGGLREAEFAPAPCWGRPAAWARRAWRRMAWDRARREAEWWRTTVCLDPASYPVFPSLAEMPSTVFENPALVVERFLPEREGDLYALRSCAFLGDRYVNVRLLSPAPVVKASTVAREEVPPHEEVFEVRRRLGLDFGKIDYVVRDGRAVVFDANRTPAFGAGGAAFRARVSTVLAEGLASLLA